jgi:uncharacterized membrane protein
VLAIVRQYSHPSWFRVLAIIVLLLGIYFRFVNLDRKVYWVDETFTSLRTSGYTMSDVAKKVFTGSILSRDDLLKFQRPSPEKTTVDTVKALASEAPEHPPLYYILARWWVLSFGSSVAAIRSLSAAMSLLTFPAMYWLCWELFDSLPSLLTQDKKGESAIAWTAMVLVAVSPLHILYAQEAREYSLWIVTILLACAAFLRSIRLNTKWDWTMYTLAIVVGLYTYPFTALVSIGHGVYLVVCERFRLTKTVLAYCCASSIAVLAFVPWLAVLSQNFQQAAWQTETLPVLSLISGWMVNLSRVFVDVSASVENPVLGLPILALAGYSIYTLCQQTARRVWLFVCILAGVTFLPLVLLDVMGGGVRSLTVRYLIPSYLSIQMAIAYTLSANLTLAWENLRQTRLWQLVLLVLLSAGIISGIISSNARLWWNKDYYTSLLNLESATLINQSPNPLVVTDNYTIIPLSYHLDDKVKFQFVSQAQPTEVRSGFSDVFLYSVSEEVKSSLQSQIDSPENPFLIRLKK